MEGKDLYPLRCLDIHSAERYGLIILNQPLEPQMKLLKAVWAKATIKVTVDGGTNELYYCTGCERDDYIPDIITGDFDSIHSRALHYYKEKKVEVVETPDQDYTDFTKCVKVLAERGVTEKIDCLLVLGAFGGRLDQIFANIETLFQSKTILPGVPVYLYSPESMACLLSEGRHVIHTLSPYRDKWCGLIPVGSSCDCVTTTGLKWNLDKQQLKFGELISTSNTWEDETGLVTIETDQPLLWTVGINLSTQGEIIRC